MADTAQAVQKPASQSWVRFALTPLFMGAALFLAAGRIDWPGAWIFMAIVLAMQMRITFMLRRVSPDLLTERRRMQAGTKPWDKIIAPLIALVLPMAMWITAGLDLRNSWTTPIPPIAQGAGILLALAAAELAARAMAANRFFSGTVRIQTERGHHVVSTGPYATVRHPGCVGMIGITLATPLALGEITAFIPSAICVLLLIVRTVLEDRMLSNELEGYADYAGRIRWRLVPGLW